MKVDRRNPLHWLWLALFLTNALLACVLRPFLHRRRAGKVLFYGHKLGGNLAAVLRGLQSAGHGMRGGFLTMDPAYHRELISLGEPSVLAISPSAIGWLVTADAIVCDHGVHSLLPLLAWSDLAFFDVWHGIPFKGFDRADFTVQHRFEECWVASPLLKEIYVKRFGFAPERVVATGYARTDALVRRKGDPLETRRVLGLPPEGKIVTFAPTWAQDATGRSIYPFGVEEVAFLEAMTSTARRYGASVVLRTHLNSGAIALPVLPGLFPVPYARFPDTEGLLLATDVLVCDWSSIAFDYLLLQRPTIFLDVPSPFRKGLSLDASFRFGAIAADLSTLCAAIDGCLQDPGGYMAVHGPLMESIRERVYAGCADGGATMRCLGRLARFRQPVSP